MSNHYPPNNSKSEKVKNDKGREKERKKKKDGQKGMAGWPRM